MLVLLFLYAHAAIQPLQRSCGVEMMSVCRSGARVVSYYSEYMSGTDCMLCNIPHCNTSNPSTGLSCNPWLQECAMCGDPDMALIGSMYNIIIRPSCTSAEPCEGNVSFTKPIVISNLASVNVTTASYYSDSVIRVATCPFLHIIGATSITLTNLMIECESTDNLELAPAILIQDSATLSLTISDVSAFGWVQATVMLYGGIPNLKLPVKLTQLTGQVSDVTISASVYTNPIAIVATDFSGVLNVTELPLYSRIVVAPGDGGSLVIGDNVWLDIVNPAELLNIYGTPLEVEFESGDMYGFTEADVVGTEYSILIWLCISLAFMIGFSIMMFQNIFVKITRARRTQKND